jgi:hypothetical protein
MSPRKKEKDGYPSSFPAIRRRLNFPDDLARPSPSSKTRLSACPVSSLPSAADATYGAMAVCPRSSAQFGKQPIHINRLALTSRLRRLLGLKAFDHVL